MKGRPKATARWTSGARRHPGGAAQKSPTRRRAGRPRWPAAAGLRLGAGALVLPRQPSRLRPIRAPPGLGPPETDRHPSDQEGHLGAMGPTARWTYPKRAARGSYGYRPPQGVRSGAVIASLDAGSWPHHRRGRPSRCEDATRLAAPGGIAWLAGDAPTCDKQRRPVDERSASSRRFAAILGISGQFRHVLRTRRETLAWPGDCDLGKRQPSVRR